MAFHEVRFSTRIAYGSQGGPMRKTEIAELDSGYEERNTPWADSRRKYDISYGIKDLNDMHEVLEFWEARRGRLHGFRFKDWSDWKSCAPLTNTAFGDQTIGTGTGALTTFQLKKTYSAASSPYVRTIKKPVSGTVKIGVNGSNVSSGWTVDTTTGIVTFSSAPANGHSVTAGFEFDVPVRFLDDEVAIALAGWRHGSLTAIPLIEDRRG
jgi:uncharacterized protein (TIGR02217 family)